MRLILNLPTTMTTIISMTAPCSAHPLAFPPVANGFTAKGNEDGELLEAVGMEFPNANMGYTVSVYKNLTNISNPERAVRW